LENFSSSDRRKKKTGTDAVQELDGQIHAFSCYFGARQRVKKILGEGCRAFKPAQDLVSSRAGGVRRFKSASREMGEQEVQRRQGTVRRFTPANKRL